MDAEFLIVMTTVPDEAAAERLARSLTEERLAACVNISSPCRSFFWWDGKLVAENEIMLVVKTRGALYEKVEARLRALHPYSVPEVIALPVVRGSDAYLRWLREETKEGTPGAGPGRPPESC